MKNLRLCGSVAICLFLLVGCATVEVDANNIEVKQKLQFDATPSLLAHMALVVSSSFEFNTSDTSWAKALHAKVRATKVQMRATHGVSNLDFIQSAALAISNAADPQKSTRITTFKRTSATQSGPDLSVTNTAPVDVSQAWSADRVRFDVALAGVLPTTDWSADITVWLNGEIDYQF
jgi:hypothetical protein